MALYIVLGVFALLGFIFFLKPKGEKSYSDISAEELRGLLKKGRATLIDVRTKKEIQQGVIGKPLEIELGPSMKSKLDSLDRNKKYVVYCRSGRRSALASSTMEKMGFKDVNNLVGGIMGYGN